MKLSQYGYEFSPDMLAHYPVDNRDESRLMVVHRKTGAIEHRIFKDIIPAAAKIDRHKPNERRY